MKRKSRKWAAYYLHSGALMCVERGPTASAAFVRAVKRHAPKSLGALVSVLQEGQQDGDETTTYMSTLAVLQRVGLAK